MLICTLSDALLASKHLRVGNSSSLGGFYNEQTQNCKRWTTNISSRSSWLEMLGLARQQWSADSRRGSSRFKKPPLLGLIWASRLLSWMEKKSRYVLRISLSECFLLWGFVYRVTYKELCTWLCNVLCTCTELFWKWEFCFKCLCWILYTLVRLEIFNNG